MSKVTRSTGLFFVVTLIFLSISTAHYGTLLTSQLRNNQSENSESLLSTEKPDLVFLNRNEERFIYSIKNLPVPGLRNHANDNYGNCLSPEVRILNIASAYLAYSVTLDRNFTNHDIIFPFHYFW